MTHAEICPVCKGSGRVDKEITVGGIIGKITSDEKCHGCDGKGWVEVGNDNIPVPYPVPVPTPTPVQPWPWQPVPYKPEWPHVMWHYQHEVGL